jgi:phosphoribosyl-dephospho-CoA transferase
MISHSRRSSESPRRHDFVFVSPAAWRSFLETRDELADDPLVDGWINRGWPLIARRLAADEGDGVPLGLPLPPSAGKRRIGLLMDPAGIRSIARPPLLSTAFRVAPAAWKPTLRTLDQLATRLGVQARVFGSLAWCLLTGLNYLTARSDLDFILSLPRPGDFAELMTELGSIDSAAPMRLDGEIVRGDGAGVHWRELHSGAREVLAKTVGRPILLNSAEMIEQGPFLAILCVAMLIPYLLWFYCRNQILRLPRGEHTPRSCLADATRVNWFGLTRRRFCMGIALLKFSACLKH